MDKVMGIITGISVSIYYGLLGLLSLAIHIWTIIIAFKASGFSVAIVTMLFPFISQLYWGYKTWSIYGIDMLYVQVLFLFVLLCLAMLLVFITIGVIEMIRESKD